MENTSANNKRIAKNTLLLYFRTLFIMLVTLYTSRVVLNTLGVTDYGIYNVVGGVVAMFSVISGSLSSSISRFITYDPGHGDFERLKRIFRNTAGMPVEQKVVAMFMAICPAFPIPLVTNLPLRRCTWSTMSSTALA